jgi:ergothioneine biosynthesis protein EgtB
MLDIEAPPIDAARMRSAGKELLSLALMDARNRTLRWVGTCEEALAESRAGTGPMSVRQGTRHPPLWSLGQLGWYQEYWISRNLQRARGEQATPGATRLASIDPDADALYAPDSLSPDQRWQVELPDLDSVRHYLAATLDTTLELLDHANDTDEALYFFRLALFHEDRQGEAFAEWSQMLGRAVPWLPPLAVLPRRDPLLLPPAEWTLGVEAGGFSFDNERPAHVELLHEFEIDAQPVTWAQYAEFVADGGYDESNWWTTDGWAWVQREGRRSPRYVEQLRQGVLVERFGRTLRVPMGQPVLHLSWFEADAWCRWAGRRLPTELEWEAAAHQAAPRGFRSGQVWEWTAGSFRPYPGFKPGPDLLYSEPAFGSHKVLRGGSFATGERMRHLKYRNFQRPDRDDLFSGFRSCGF